MEMTDSGIPLARVAQVRWKSLIEAGTVFYDKVMFCRSANPEERGILLICLLRDVNYVVFFLVNKLELDCPVNALRQCIWGNKFGRTGFG
jgi:hypothetical protein